MEETLKQIAERLDKIDKGQDILAENMGKVLIKLDHHDAHFEAIESRLDGLTNINIGNLERRVEKLEDFRQVVKKQLKLQG